MIHTSSEYHWKTSYARQQMTGHFLDWENQPNPFKKYSGTLLSNIFSDKSHNHVINKENLCIYAVTDLKLTFTEHNPFVLNFFQQKEGSLVSRPNSFRPGNGFPAHA